VAPARGGRWLGRRLRLRLARWAVERVSSLEAADPAARLLAVDGPYSDLDNDGERHVIDEWRQHIAPFRNLE
jgi:hypothetical protein